MAFRDKSEPRDVSAAAVSKELRAYAAKTWPLGNAKSHKLMLGERLELSARRVRSFWQGEETAVPRTKETDRIERLIGKKIGAADEEAKGVGPGQAEYRALEARLTQVEALLQTVHAEFYQPHVDAVREQARGSFAVARGPRAIAQNGSAADGPDD